MRFMIEVPEEMIQCKATEALDICLQEQVDAMCAAVQERIDKE